MSSIPMRLARSARGFVNAHTHVYSGLTPFGMPQPGERPVGLLAILEQVWWRLDRALDLPTLRAAARWYVLDALRHGTTTLVDHHESPNAIAGSLDVIAEACEEMGMRALLCYGATERNGGRDEARAGLAECERFLRENTRANVRGLVGLHASFTVSRETLVEAGALARRHGVGVHVHVAEDAADVEHAQREQARDPMLRMLSAGALPPGSVLAHAVHLGAESVRAARTFGFWIVQNPRSNEGNGVGYPRALAETDQVALGTDGWPSDLRDEFAALERLAARHEPGTTPEALAGRLHGGARLAEAHFGAAAFADDLVEFGPSTTPGVRPLAEHVVIAGRTVVREGRVEGVNAARIESEARAAAAALWTRMAAFA